MPPVNESITAILESDIPKRPQAEETDGLSKFSYPYIEEQGERFKITILAILNYIRGHINNSHIFSEKKEDTDKNFSLTPSEKQEIDPQSQTGIIELPNEELIHIPFSDEDLNSPEKNNKQNAPQNEDSEITTKSYADLTKENPLKYRNIDSSYEMTPSARKAAIIKELQSSPETFAGEVKIPVAPTYAVYKNEKGAQKWLEISSNEQGAYQIQKHLEETLLNECKLKKRLIPSILRQEKGNNINIVYTGLSDGTSLKKWLKAISQNQKAEKIRLNIIETSETILKNTLNDPEFIEICEEANIEVIQPFVALVEDLDPGFNSKHLMNSTRGQEQEFQGEKGFSLIIAGGNIGANVGPSKFFKIAQDNMLPGDKLVNEAYLHEPMSGEVKEVTKNYDHPDYHEFALTVLEDIGIENPAEKGSLKVSFHSYNGHLPGCSALSYIYTPHEPENFSAHHEGKEYMLTNPSSDKIAIHNVVRTNSTTVLNPGKIGSKGLSTVKTLTDDDETCAIAIYENDSVGSATINHRIDPTSRSYNEF